MEKWKIVVEGKVQGVFYRASTVEYVQNNISDITGFVRNLMNGSVEIIAEADALDLEKLVLFCKKGPKYAKVESIQIEKKSITQKEYDNFALKR